MVKKSMIYMITVALAAGSMLAGCGQKTNEKMDEYRNLGLSQLQSGEYVSAAESFQTALDQSHGRVGTEEIDLCYYKALALEKSGDFQGSIDTYTGLITYDSENWEAYYLRANVYLQDGQGKNALSDYNTAVEMNPEDFELYAHIAENLAVAGYEDKGDGYLDQALALSIETPEDYYGIGQIYFLKGDFTNAETCLIQASSDGCDEALLTLGKVCMAQGKEDEAIDAFDSYAVMYHDDAYALYNLGKAALQAGCYENALTYISQAFESAEEADQQEMQRTLIAAYEHTGNYGAAYDLAAAYLNMYPDDTQMQRELEFLSTRIGDDIIEVPKEEQEDKQEEPDETESTDPATGDADSSADATDAVQGNIQ